MVLTTPYRVRQWGRAWLLLQAEHVRGSWVLNLPTIPVLIFRAWLAQHSHARWGTASCAMTFHVAWFLFLPPPQEGLSGPNGGFSPTAVEKIPFLFKYSPAFCCN
ncbi:hypothetical protein Poly41_37800 [Novipirellula artificiosorum]|uniref:Uncharacterized protein n=1 Tax=Novipirellula artificiosorum TaxID=2528016 RepID=A0A5C6DJE4_9BACT|nr:hypothetical protein Poly41_37800 [Novipirellula artificiosorum]